MSLYVNELATERDRLWTFVLYRSSLASFSSFSSFHSIHKFTFQTESFCYMSTFFSLFSAAFFFLLVCVFVFTEWAFSILPLLLLCFRFVCVSFSFVRHFQRHLFLSLCPVLPSLVCQTSFENVFSLRIFSSLHRYAKYNFILSLLLVFFSSRTSYCWKMLLSSHFPLVSVRFLFFPYFCFRLSFLFILPNDSYALQKPNTKAEEKKGT